MPLWLLLSSCLKNLTPNFLGGFNSISPIEDPALPIHQNIDSSIAESKKNPQTKGSITIKRLSYKEEHPRILGKMKSARFDTRLPNLESQLESILSIDTLNYLGGPIRDSGWTN